MACVYWHTRSHDGHDDDDDDGHGHGDDGDAQLSWPFG